MTTCITKCIILAILSIAMSPHVLIQGQQAPCLFYFGDSYFDNGNNNNLNTIARANYLPYGIDYGVTGRFTNDGNIADYLAQLLGFRRPIRPYATGGGTTTILQGQNYASAASGILYETSYQFGDRIWMDRQLSNHEVVVGRFTTLLGGNQTVANNQLKKCLYAVSMGSDDYITNYYFRPPVTLSALLSTEAFAQKLIDKFSQQLTRLYNLQARKIAVFSPFPIGCLPNSIAQFPTNGAPCVENINQGVQIFNNKLISLVNNLNANLSGAHFTFINTFDIVSGNLSSIGVQVQNVPCCNVTLISFGLCVRDGNVCGNRDEYAYFDNYNPTRVLANYAASRAYKALLPSDATPVDISTLILT